MDEGSFSPEQNGASLETQRGQIKERVGEELKPILAFLKSSVVKEGTLKGLLPYSDRDGNTKYRSEDLGYGLKLAVETNDQILFRQLHDGVQALRITEGQGQGLFRASLDSNDNPIASEGTSWADGDQDIALALLEAGLKWGDQAILAEGKAAAEAFINSSHITKVGDNLGITATLAEDQRNLTGDRIRTVNLSMYNFKLYELMQQLEPSNLKWQKLHESGLELTRASLTKFKLPPDHFYAIDGRTDLISDTEIYNKLDPNSASFDRSLTETVEPTVLSSVISTSKDQFRAKWSNDAIRIPYRLTDATDPKLHELSQQILQRLDASGGLRKRIYADNGESVDTDNETPGYILAPLAKTMMEKSGDGIAVIDQLVKNTGDWEKTRVYNQAWVGLGLSQIAA